MAKNGQRGTTLKRKREAQGIKQFEMAARLGVSPAYLSMMENEHGGWGLPRGFAAAFQRELQQERTA